ncbi:MAG: hypothetical protein KQI62_02040 [Deltaproteobacteria bacterium]|nr:hypothetical protein [Deltaproteobacteria bacterium]
MYFIGKQINVWAAKKAESAKTKKVIIYIFSFVTLFFILAGIAYYVIPNKIREEKPPSLNDHEILPPSIVGNSNNENIKLVKLYWDNPKSPKYLVYEYIVLSGHAGHNSTKMRVVMYDHDQKILNDVYIKLPQEQLLARGDIREGLVVVPKNVTRANIILVDK